jgi:hypothetical protein
MNPGGFGQISIFVPIVDEQQPGTRFRQTTLLRQATKARFLHSINDVSQKLMRVFLTPLSHMFSNF